MAGVNFKGAKYFSINGGNFSEVKGNMNTYHFNGGGAIPAAQSFADLPGVSESRRERKARLRQQYERGPLPIASIQPASDSGSSGSSGSSTTSSGHYRPAIWSPPTSTNPSPQRIPISPDPSLSSPAHRPSSTTSTSGASAYHSPNGIIASPDSDISELDDDDSSAPSRYSTPDTSGDETHNGPSILPEHPLDQLSPLTNSLGLQRFTPANQFQPLVPSEFATPQSQNSENRPPGRAQPQVPMYGQSQATHAPPPPPIPPRPEHLASEHQIGPPPPIPPRPIFPSSLQQHATSAPAVPQVQSPATPALSDLEDPSTRFARLQAQRQTKGYSSGLGENVAYSSPPLNAPRALPQPPQAPRPGANSVDTLQHPFSHGNDLQIYPITPSSTIQSPTSPPPMSQQPLPSDTPASISSVLGSPGHNNVAPHDQGYPRWNSNWENGSRSEREDYVGGFAIRHGPYPQQPPQYQHPALSSSMPAPPMYPQVSQQWGLPRHPYQQHPHPLHQNDYQRQYRDQAQGYARGPFNFPGRF